MFSCAGPPSQPGKYAHASHHPQHSIGSEHTWTNTWHYFPFFELCASCDQELREHRVWPIVRIITAVTKSISQCSENCIVSVVLQYLLMIFPHVFALLASLLVIHQLQRAPAKQSQRSSQISHTRAEKLLRQSPGHFER